MTAISVRPYQQQLIDDTRKLLTKNKRVIILSVTGSGKTRTSAAIVESAVAKGKQVLFLVAGRQLVTQALKSYTDLGIDAGVIMAGFTYRHDAPVQVSSVHTLASRLDSLDFLSPDLIITDEAHTALGDMFKRVRERWPNAYEVGLTATPKPTEVYGAMSYGPSYDFLINEGYLVRPRFFSVPEADLSKLRVSAGEYTENSQAEAFRSLTLVGGIVEKWRKHCEGRPTVVFAPNVATSIRNAEAFNAAGIPAFHIDANTSHDDRQAAFKALRDGDIKILANYGVLGKGFDEPCISAVIFERVTKSISVYIQAIGRALRVYPGKRDAIVLDLGDNAHRFGDFTTDEVQWTLDNARDVETERQERLEAAPRKDVTCYKCAFVYPAGPRCTNCGAAPEKTPPKAKDDARIDAELTEVKPKSRKREFTFADKRRYYAMLSYYAATKDKPIGWVLSSYYKRFGAAATADVRLASPTPPDQEVARWIQSRNIAYARRPQQAPYA